jgi:magnesium chelatase subunit I
VVRIDRPQEADVVREIIRSAGSREIAVNTSLALGNHNVLPALQENLDTFLSQLYVRFQLESIRGIQAIRLGTHLHAMQLGKNVADFSDMAAVLPAALRHRVRPHRMQEILDEMRQAISDDRKTDSPPAKIKGEPQCKTPRYPALWKGLWQRVTNGQSQATGKTVAVEAKPEAAAGTTAQEKKTAAVPITPDPTVRPQK